MDQKDKPKNARVKRTEFTALGEIYYKAQPWQRMKIETEMLEELGVKYPSVRAYMISTPAFRMRADMREIVLRTLPDASVVFDDTRMKTE